MSTIRAVRVETCGAAEQMTVQAIPEPVPGPKEVRIRMSACGINLIDTAEQYPIPSNPAAFSVDGDTERIIGSWMAKDKSRRSKVVIASKITGGRNVNAANIISDCEASLKRLGTD